MPADMRPRRFVRQKCGPEKPQTAEAIERETKVAIVGNEELQRLLSTHERVLVVDATTWVFKVCRRTGTVHAPRLGRPDDSRRRR